MHFPASSCIVSLQPPNCFRAFERNKNNQQKMPPSSVSQAPSPPSDEVVEHADQHCPSHHDSLLASILHPSPTLDEPGRKLPKLTSQPTTTIVESHPPSGLNGPLFNDQAGPSKPRGRPKGSKNKPKQAEVAHVEPTMKTLVLEFAPGSDIVELVQKFARDHNVGVTIVNGAGRVQDVAVRNPVAQDPSIILSGAHDLLTISGVHVGPANWKLHPPELATGKSFFTGAHINYVSVHLLGPTGAVWGGVVMGKLIAASNVLLNVLTFVDYEFHRLAHNELDLLQRPTTSHGVGSSMGRSGVDPGVCSSIGPVAYAVNDGRNWDPSLISRKRAHLSDY